MRMHIVDKTIYSQLLQKARRSTRKIPGTEICGLMVNTGYHLSFVSIRNVSSHVGSFVLSRSDVRRVAAAVKILGQEIVGTFHSHPVAPATPSESDIQNAVDNSLMFIFDCIGKEGRLWRIKRRKANLLTFHFLQDAMGIAPDKLKSPSWHKKIATTPRQNRGGQGRISDARPTQETS
jgi:[CysO sulfur-carrier protein]-S-L-cysteine hydrolase